MIAMTSLFSVFTMSLNVVLLPPPPPLLLPPPPPPDEAFSTFTSNLVWAVFRPSLLAVTVIVAVPSFNPFKVITLSFSVDFTILSSSFLISILASLGSTFTVRSTVLSTFTVCLPKSKSKMMMIKS